MPVVNCDFVISSKCKKTWHLSDRCLRKTRSNNYGKIICLYCSRKLKHSGRKNPNCKYKVLDDNFFNVVDTEEKAYLLGWIASDGTIKKNSVQIRIHQKDVEIINKLRDVVCVDLPVKYLLNKKQVEITINSISIAESCADLLHVVAGKPKFDTVQLPSSLQKQFVWAFIRGYFDGDGTISNLDYTNLSCSITSNSKVMLQALKIEAGGNINNNKIVWNGYNALDFLGKMYDGSKIFLRRKKELYEDWSGWIPSLSGRGTCGKMPLFKWSKTDSRASAPSKIRPTDSGYDLTLIDLKEVNGKVEIYDTGIKIEPEYGWYFDLVARSSLWKFGRMLANGIGVIDRTYRGSVLVAMLKFDENADSIKLPARLVQIVPRTIVHGVFGEELLDNTDRNDGGFGSTGTR